MVLWAVLLVCTSTCITLLPSILAKGRWQYWISPFVCTCMCICHILVLVARDILQYDPREPHGLVRSTFLTTIYLYCKHSWHSFIPAIQYCYCSRSWLLYGWIEAQRGLKTQYASCCVMPSIPCCFLNLDIVWLHCLLWNMLLHIWSVHEHMLSYLIKIWSSICT